MSSSGFSPVASSPSVPPWGTRDQTVPPPVIPYARYVVFAFTQADLVGGIFTGVHNFAQPFVTFAVYDDGELVVMPDEAESIDGNTFAIDLTNYAPIPGTWHLVVVG